MFSLFSPASAQSPDEESTSEDGFDESRENYPPSEHMIQICTPKTPQTGACAFMRKLLLRLDVRMENYMLLIYHDVDHIEQANNAMLVESN